MFSGKWHLNLVTSCIRFLRILVKVYENKLDIVWLHDEASKNYVCLEEKYASYLSVGKKLFGLLRRHLCECD